MNKEFFKNPVNNPDYSISGFWFWNDEITDEKTTEQLSMMHRIHADQPVIHARFGLQNKYLSQDWFDRIESSVLQAGKNNQKIWLYDENNWPSGNCSWEITKDENLREHFLQFEITKVALGEVFTLDLKSRKYINVTGYDELNPQGHRLIPDKAGDLITYLPEVDTEIYAVYVAVDEYEHVGKLCVDYLSKQAIRKFIESTHEKYAEHFGEHFGKIITGIFMDETRFCNAMPWTNTLPDEFKKRKGYDLIPELPLLVKKNERAKRVRYDYYDVISDMLREATFKQIFDWCEEHGLKTTGHFLGEETLAAQSYFNGDMMRAYKYLHVPGIDHLGNGIGSLDAKFCTSASHNYGKTRISCESFGASGWDITFEEMVKISNWLFQQGINLIILHGFYYSIRDERASDFPPSYFYQWKYWDSMPMYALMAARMSEMLSNGRHEADIMVYYPMETFWNYFDPDLETKTGFWEEGPWIKDEKAKFIDNQYQQVCNALLDKNLDFDILNSDAADNFKAEDGKLINLLTGEAFRVFVLPLTEMIPENVVSLLNAFSSQGGKVISYRSDIRYVVRKDANESTQSLDTSEYSFADKISDIIEECKQNIRLPYSVMCGVSEVSRTVGSYPARLIDPYIHDNEQQYGIGITRYIKRGKRILNFTNYNAKDEDLKISVEAKTVPEIFIPETGQIYTVKDFEIIDGAYQFSVTLPKNRTYFVVSEI